MKLQIVLVAALVILVNSEPPRGFNRNYQYQFQRVEEAPYPPSGYRPAGAEFRLPSRQQPQTLYGPPPNAYLPPSATEPSDPTTTTETTEDGQTTTEEPFTTTTYSPVIAELKKKPERIQEEQVLDQGVYYIYHPNGFLQRVMYETRNDVRNMGYTAQLTYRDVEPIKDPVYTYDPETLVFQQIKL